MQTVAVARNAMATRFEIALHGEDPVALRAAGEEALDEIERIEAQISLYRPTSEIARVNARAAREPVRVSSGVFRLLAQATELSRQTGGAFDITIAPLVRCWGFMGGTGQLPAPADVAAARECVGTHLLELDADDLTVRFLREGVMIDLGAIGKGYAVGCAAERLREAGMTSALIHGGTSTIYALGHPPDQEHWKVAVEYPKINAGADPSGLLATIPLRDEALSVSAVWGRSFQSQGKTLGHVLNPRTGEPVGNALLAAMVLPVAMETDALSTALLVLGEGGLDLLAGLRRGARTLLLREDAESEFQGTGRGIKTHPPPPEKAI